MFLIDSSRPRYEMPLSGVVCPLKRFRNMIEVFYTFMEKCEGLRLCAQACVVHTLAMSVLLHSEIQTERLFPL